MILNVNFFSLILTIFFLSFITIFFISNHYSQKRKKTIQSLITEAGLSNQYQDYISVLHDLSGHVHFLRAQLSQLRTNLLDLLDQFSLAAAFLDKENDLLQYNHSFARLTGTMKKEKSEISLADFPVFGPLLLNMTVPNQTINIGQMKIEIRMTQNGGTRFFILTDLRLREKEESDRQYLIHAIWHEVKTPLTVMEGYIKLLLEETTDPFILQACRKIDSQVERLMKVTSQLRLLNRMAPGNSEFANAQNVIEIIQQVLDSWQLDINALTIQILFHSHEIEKGKFTLRLNRGDFFIIASNLISNAIKFNRPGGSLTITLSIQYDNLVCQVEDTGNGIPLEMQDVIFEPFGYSSATGKKSQGTGLYLVKEAVNRGGGRIHHQSQPGEGTVVRIFLPFR